MPKQEHAQQNGTKANTYSNTAQNNRNNNIIIVDIVKLLVYTDSNERLATDKTEKFFNFWIVTGSAGKTKLF